MSIYEQNQIYPSIIPDGTQANAISIPVMGSPFETLKFTIQTDANAAFDITALQSNQDIPPNPATPELPSNLYSDILFTDDSTGVNYNSTSPVVVAGASTKTFTIQTHGARWIFIKLSSYSAGTLLKCDAELFAN